ncbi:tetratricopeptide repeat protein [Comamonas piscis]|uniref:Ancillary SecYEG translocon subunit n=1 Tax=Comamonas piscis TaxID=1562974 RepID=A0A7G5EHE9_9BURK|nr:tetratricopeptide repeat protein [Comamonas piscis]QMV73424.1 tetratricopeptide repeat protein [Comamonas piscis]WSO36230.1 tetratricopeptide repeat protein [Comamonas piscis]
MATHLDLEEQEQIDQLKHFWNKWGTLITTVLVVVMGGFAAWNGYQYWQNRQASQASALSSAVEAAVNSGDKTRIDQAFGDLRSNYGGTIQAAHAGLLVAKAAGDKGQMDDAKAALTWVADNASDEGLKATARVRLAAVLLNSQAYDEALKVLNTKMPTEFDAVVADHKGDVYLAKGDKAQAIESYKSALQKTEPGVEYRNVISVKLNALGEDLK